MSQIICFDLFHKMILKAILSWIRVSVKLEFGVIDGDLLSEGSNPMAKVAVFYAYNLSL